MRVALCAVLLWACAAAGEREMTHPYLEPQRDGRASLLAAALEPDSLRRPQMSPEVALELGALVDSLSTLLPEAGVRSISVRPGSGLREGSGSGDEIRLRRPDRRGLLHEYGHRWALKNAGHAVELADSLSFDPYTRRGEERLADLFVDAFNQYALQEEPKRRDVSQALNATRLRSRPQP